MKQITPNYNLGLPALMSAFVAGNCSQNFVKGDTWQNTAGTAHCPATERTKTLPYPPIRKWLSALSLATLLGALALSGCSSEQSAEQEKESAAGKPVHKEVGEASWYGPGFKGKETANGEAFNQKEMTAAHPSLPMGTKAKVTNLENGKEVEVRINDRGPFTEDRVIDLSGAAAKKLDMKKDGTSQVKIETKPTKKSSANQSGETKRGAEKTTSSK